MLTDSLAAEPAPRMYDGGYGAGRDLFSPVVHADVMRREPAGSAVGRAGLCCDPDRVRVIPGLGHEHRITNVAGMFAGDGRCCVCGGRFPEGPRQDGHLECHRALLKEYLPFLHEIRDRDERAAAARHMLDVFPGPPPGAQKLARHVKLYGDECVADTMVAYEGHDLPLLAYTSLEPEGRRTTPELRRLIHRLVSRGFVIGAVAKTLNLKDARVRLILREPPPS